MNMHRVINADIEAVCARAQVEILRAEEPALVEGLEPFLGAEAEAFFRVVGPRVDGVVDLDHGDQERP